MVKFKKVGPATQKVLDQMSMLTIGTKSKLKLDDLTWIGVFTRASHGCICL